MYICAFICVLCAPALALSFTSHSFRRQNPVEAHFWAIFLVVTPMDSSSSCLQLLWVKFPFFIFIHYSVAIITAWVAPWPSRGSLDREKRELKKNRIATHLRIVDSPLPVDVWWMTSDERGEIVKKGRARLFACLCALAQSLNLFHEVNEVKNPFLPSYRLANLLFSGNTVSNTDFANATDVISWTPWGKIIFKK